jgi:hypothetical protein
MECQRNVRILRSKTSRLNRDRTHTHSHEESVERRT